MASPCNGCVRFNNPHCDIAEVAQKSKTDAASVTSTLPSSLDSNTKAETEKSDVEVLKLRLASLENLMVEMAHHKSSTHLPPAVAPDAEFSFHDAIRPMEYLDTAVLRRLGLLRWLVLASLDDGLFTALQNMLPCQQAKNASTNTNTETESQPRLMALLLCTESAAVAVLAFGRPSLYLRLDIQAALPLRRRVWMLVDRFFNVLYPFVPVLDELEFRTAMSGVIGPKILVEESVEVNPRGDGAYAHLGILLTVLRMAHMSLFDNCNRVRTSCFYNSASELAYLAQTVVPSNCEVLAEECVRQYDLVRDVRLECIQLLAMLRVLMMYNPDSSYPDLQNQTYLAILFLLLLVRWLNREPRTVFNMDLLGYRKTMLLRKLWHTIVDIDLHAAVFSGNLLAINPNSHDVQLPVFRANGLNIDDTRLDAAVCNAFAKSGDVRKVLFEALALTGKVSGPVLLHEVERVMASLVQKEHDLWIVVGHCLRSPLHNMAESYARASDFYSFIRVYYVLVGISAHLYYYHMRMHHWDAAYAYRRHIMSLMTQHLLPLLPAVLDDSRSPFGGTCDLITTSLYFNCVVQTVVLMWAMYMDYKTQLHYLQARPELANDVTVEYNAKVTALTSLTELLFILVSCISNAVSLTLERYKFNNKIVWGHKMISKLSTYPGYFEKQGAPMELLGADRLNELNGLVTACLQDESFGDLKSTDTPMIPSPDSVSSQLLNSFSSFEPNFNLLLFEDLFNA